MPKSLGQIHTVSHEWPNLSYPLLAGNKLLVDLPGELTRQLQHMVRMMSSFKVVGIDLAYGPILNASEVSCSMSGQIKYFAPTQGRVEAIKMAYHAVRRMMKISGVDPKDAITYDFRPMIVDPADFENGADVGNQASIEDNGLASCLVQGPAGSTDIFELYNEGITPSQAVGAAGDFERGFDIGLRSNVASSNWVLNEKVMLSALTAPEAFTDLEMIPFELSTTTADTAAGISSTNVWQWRPDPALYLSVLTGQLIIEIEESACNQAGVEDFDKGQLDVSVHVAGWKSILGSKKRRHSKRRKSHGRKRHSKK